MKIKFFIPLGLALMDISALLWSQDYIGMIVKDGATVNVFNGASVYCSANLEVEEQGKVDNKGNIKVDGAYKNNNQERNNKNVILRYEAENKYGQLILKEGQNIDGRTFIEYPATNVGYVFGALPFSNVYDAKFDLAQDIYGRSSDFVYDANKTVQALENSTLLKFKAINDRNIAQWEAVDTGISLDLTKAHVFKAGNGLFSLSGVPVSGPYRIQYQGLSNVDLNTAVTDYYDANTLGPQRVNQLIGGDYFENRESADRGRRFFPFANPTTSNVDLLKIGGFSDNVKGVAIPREIGKSDNNIAHLTSYYISSFRNGIPTGDLDALSVRPRSLVYVKMKQGKEQDLIINDDAKTFNQKSSYRKGSAYYEKLCLAFGDKRAYVFVTDGVMDGEFVEGEAYQPKASGESSIFTLQNKINIDTIDYNKPLHTNIISRAWDKPIRLIVNDTSGKGKIEVLKQEGCTPRYFSMVKKGQPKGQGLTENQSIQIKQQGWGFYDIYYNNPIVVRRSRTVSDETERMKSEAFWCEGGQVCFNYAAEGKNVDIRLLSQDGSLQKEDKVPALRPYKLPFDVGGGLYTVQYRFEDEKEFKALQVLSIDN